MENVVSEAAATLPYTVALHASTRILTFILNSILLRLVTHDVLGLANVRLQLLYSTVAFIAREPFRRALPAGESLEKNNETKTLNSRNWAIVRTNWLCPLLAIAVGLPLTAVWIYLLEEPPEKFATTYFISTLLYALAACAEAMGEPACAAAHLASNFKLRMKSEGMAVGVRTVLTVFLVWFWAPREGQTQTCVGCELYGFALAQFLSSVIYTAWMWLSTIRIMKLAKSENSSSSTSFFEPGYLRLSVSFLAHSIVKQLLTEGERYVMTATGLLSFAQQGVYDVVNNLGSLVARLVFLPLEDTAYLVFCQMLDRKHQSSAADLPSKSVVLLTRTLTSTLKASLLVGFGCAVFGWFYSDIVLVTYAGQSFVDGSEAVPLLQFFCVYTIFLAANGITESFVMAGMSQQDLDWHNLFDIGVSIVYTGATVFLANRYGSLGFIFANMFNMFCRIGHSLHWIDSFYHNTNFTPLRSSLPAMTVIVCLTCVAIVASILNHLCPAILCRFACGGVLGVISLIVFYAVERSHLRYIFDLVAQKDRKRDEL